MQKNTGLLVFVLLILAHLPFSQKVAPQFYYLKQDERDGFYVTSKLTLAKRNFPLSISAIINKTIQTDITAGKNFVWNESLIYSFNKKYVKI